MSDQLVIGGRVMDKPSQEWAALRSLAAGWRDSLGPQHPLAPSIQSLISLLDSHDHLRKDFPTITTALWDSAVRLAEQLAQKMGATPRKPAHPAQTTVQNPPA